MPTIPPWGSIATLLPGPSRRRVESVQTQTRYALLNGGNAAMGLRRLRRLRFWGDGTGTATCPQPRAQCSVFAPVREGFQFVQGVERFTRRELIRIQATEGCQRNGTGRVCGQRLGRGRLALGLGGFAGCGWGESDEAV